MYGPETISTSTPVARKDHVCWNCGHKIRRGTQYQYDTYKYDEVYRIKSHTDCIDAAHHLAGHIGWEYFDEGLAPLMQMMTENGEFELEANYLRGHFPHVVTRLEYVRAMREQYVR